MANVGTIRNSLQAAVSGITGLNRYDVATGKERLPAYIVFPRPPASGTVVASTCKERWEFTIEIHVSLAQGLQRAQDQLDGFISTASGGTSIATTIEADVTLSSAVDTLTVDAFELYSFGELNAKSTLMTIIPVVVWVDK